MEIKKKQSLKHSMYLNKNKLTHLRTFAAHQNSLRFRQTLSNLTIFCTCLKQL